ncbi:hypothetical protein SAMN02800692_2037 [Luteibacter sp. UNC138MFCol5.1]|uniref:hypothetical protein n=1 Tax=Luteibacter sp. UNC138MFCol5.1 TaxID=1502774 RepID=UPI0008BBA696|nr:hypothetical protein [Luteibacter sp. UNC138MFCol5.1]SEO77076.1 hypothetical protein SAMN02800692_2037 [Luteibacter sp. UNC138MFCol5.1]
MSTENTADAILAAVCDALHIGSAVRSMDVVMTNIGNLQRRSACLDGIERAFFTEEVPDEDDPSESIDECSLSWGATPEQYVETFGELLAERAKSAQQAAEPVEQPRSKWPKGDAAFAESTAALNAYLDQLKPEQAVGDGVTWISRTALPMVNPAQMVRIAQNYARVDTDHAYTKVPNFMPHDWVVAAMCAAYDAGRQNIIDGTHIEGYTPEAIESVRRIFAPRPAVVTAGDGVTDEMVRRATAAYVDAAPSDCPVDVVPARIRAAIIAAHPHTGYSAVPEGWKLVPVEPSWSMVKAGNASDGTMLGIYTAMIAAAPEGPE